MQLKTKFILFIGIVLLISFGITFYSTSYFQKKLVFNQAVNQARMLHRQIKLTRQWVADHNGLFLIKKDGVKPNPFLVDAEIKDSDGQWLVKRNPAMVTRELSLYASGENFCSYGVTSLQPINPSNTPDDFEKKGLNFFEQGGKEIFEVQQQDKDRFLRYFAPLVVDQPCMQCHREQGYQVGDIRGGLSVTIPMDWAYQSIEKNDRMLFIFGIATIALVNLIIFVFFDLLVVRRLKQLTSAMDEFSEDTKCAAFKLPAGNDEVGRMSQSFMELCQRFNRSRQELARSRDQVIQNEKQAALGRLVAGLGHEINNPLAGMLNCVKTMKEMPNDRDLQQRYLNLLSKGLNRIKHTVGQLLNFGRQESLKIQVVLVDELILECCDLLGYALKNVEMILETGMKHSVLLDKEALKQVVMNMAINAIHAMPEGGTFQVSSRETDTGLILKFQDNGIGIAPENLSKIFEPFFTTKDVGEGTGLGLSVTYTLVQRMGGTIQVKSEPNRGTCFLVELPADKKEKL